MPSTRTESSGAVHSYISTNHLSTLTPKVTANRPSPTTHTTMADALKAEGNKLFAEKKYSESM